MGVEHDRDIGCVKVVNDFNRIVSLYLLLLFGLLLLGLLFSEVHAVVIGDVHAGASSNEHVHVDVVVLVGRGLLSLVHEVILGPLLRGGVLFGVAGLVEGLLLLVDVLGVDEIHLVDAHVGVHDPVGDIHGRELVVVHELLVVLLLDELLKAFLVHVGHQLAEYLRVVQGHVLQELRQLVDRNSHGLALSAKNLYELDGFMSLAVLQVVPHLHLLDRVHHALHVIGVVNPVVLVRSKRIQVVVRLRVVVLVIRHELIVLVRRLLGVVALRVIWQRHRILVIHALLLSAPLYHARYYETHGDQHYQNRYNDNYGRASSTLRRFVNIH